MANVLVERSYLEDIADSIRGKLGVADTYKPSEMSDAIDSISGGGITPTGTININSNGSHDVTQYATAAVNVPNSYSASDEGKVVNNGALVAQTSDTVTENGPVDTTLINSLTVNVSGGGGIDADTGDFTLVSDSNDITITTTKLRNRLYIWADTLPLTSNNLVFTFCEYDWPTTDYRGMYGYISTYPSISQQATIADASHTASTFNIKPHATTRQFVSGIKYNYIAF